MARIANFTTSGQPTAAPSMTLDALMARSRELGRNRPSANREMISPWQGAAYLGEVIGQGIEQNSVDKQLADQRAQFAQLMSGIDYSGEGPTGQQIGSAMMYDEQAGAALAQLAAQRAQARMERQQQLADRDENRAYTEGYETRKFDRTNADQIADEERANAAKIAEEQRAASRGSTTLGKLKSDLAAGLLTQEQYDAAVADELRPPATSGMELEFDEDGRVTGFRQGTGVGGGKSAATQGGKNLANAQDEYRAAAKAANDLLPTIANMETVGDAAGYTGPGGGLWGTIDDFGEAVQDYTGLPTDIIPGSSSARSVIKSGGLTFILDAVQKTKGSISNAENQLFASQAPGLQTTPEGRKTLLGIARGVAKRAIQRDELAQKWIGENGSLQGFEQAWNTYIESNPLIAADQNTGGLTLLGDGSPDAPAPGGGPAATGTEPPADGNYAVGQTYTFDEGTFQFLGGDPTARTSWRATGGR